MSKPAHLRLPIRMEKAEILFMKIHPQVVLAIRILESRQLSKCLLAHRYPIGFFYRFQGYLLVGRYRVIMLGRRLWINAPAVFEGTEDVGRDIFIRKI
jgi:hypothetical protein